MSRNIPAQIQSAIDSPSSTLTRLLRINLNNGTSYGLCMSNRDVSYSHGDGMIVYSATNGFDPSEMSSDVSYSVDNAQGYALISDDVPGITQQSVDDGLLDGASWVCYYVDYEHPYSGSAVILDAGDVGIVQVQFGMLWIPELLSYLMRLKQNVGDVYSRTCRAEFGSPASSQHGCGVDAEALWQDFTVASVGEENDRTFSFSGVAENPLKPFYPGRIKWTSGDNVGRSISTESYSEDTAGYSEVSLMETVPYPVKVGDVGRIRPDCSKTWEQCGNYDNQLNMKAEPLIPVGDTAAIQVPGAQT